MWIAENWKDYKLLDTSDGERLEKWGEYILVRPYYLGDLYPLTKPVKDEYSWCASQWDRPEHNDGMIQIFRREKSPYSTATFPLEKIDITKKYHFTDIDGGEFDIDGKALANGGFCVTINEKRTAKIYLYKAI